MKNWRDIYKERLTTAPEAVKHIKSGNRVLMGHAVGEASHIIAAMMDNKEAYRDVEVVHMVAMGKCEYAKPGMEPYFRHNALFVGRATRDTIVRGHGDFTPCYFSQIPYLWNRTLPIDVALLQVSPPDAHGYCSLGVSVDYGMQAIQDAKMIIAQVNAKMPRTLGNSFVHVSQLDVLVEHDEQVIMLNPPKITDVEKEIGRHCASLVRDGDCLQLGIGAIPDAVLLFLKDKKDLGIHTEMFSDGVVELVEAGVVTGAKKNLHNGKLVAAFLMGTQRLYDFVHDNPMVHMEPVTYTNNPYVAGQNDNLVSINSCVQVDFLGQVCSESIGTMQITAVGGQVDFVRATAISKGGRSILAMPSTNTDKSGKTVSKIVSVLDEGASVTTNKYDVDTIVTEYGVARLKFLPTRERARRLINIAHPDFRDELKADFEKRFNVKFDDPTDAKFNANFK